MGRACGRMWARAGVFEIQDVLTRSRESAAEGVKFIGAGHAVGHLDEMRDADVWMIATRDDAIVPSAETLAASGKITPDDIVFHVSGATPSGDLKPVKAHGALVASVHPIKTFTDAELAARTFPGTFCGAEGDAGALAVLKPAFEKIGAKRVRYRPGAEAGLSRRRRVRVQLPGGADRSGAARAREGGHTAQGVAARRSSPWCGKRWTRSSTRGRRRR